VNIELNLSDIPKWPTHDSPDIMFYIGHLEDSSLKRVFLARNCRLLLASPDYVQSAPPIVSPVDLQQHKCIVLRENDEDATMWRFTEASTERVTSVRVSPALASNVGQVVKDWCIQGQGIIQRSEWDVQAELNSGTLVEVLTSYRLATADIVALLSSEQFNRSRKITSFLDFAKKRLVERLHLV
jgi:DNA-binding transcriptional LysR family regulator